MARQSVLLAAAVLLSVALWTTSAAKYYGGFEGPSLFAPAGADKDSAVIGVHVELGMLTEAAKGNTDAIGAAAKALASDLFSAGAPCYMDGMSIVADPATFAFPDEEKGRFDTMFTMKVERSDGGDWPVDEFNYRLWNCMPRGRANFTDPGMENPTLQGFGFKWVQVQSRVFEVHFKKDFIEPAHFRYRGFAAIDFPSVAEAQSALDVIGSPMYRLFMTTCLADEDESDGFIYANDVHFAWKVLDEEDDVPQPSVRMKFVVDVPWNNDARGDDDVPLMPQHMEHTDLQKCLSETHRFMGLNNSKIDFATGSIKSIPMDITSRNNRGGVGLAIVHGAASYADMLRENNAAQAEMLMTGVVDGGRRNASSGLRADPSWIDVIGVHVMGDDLVILTEVSAPAKMSDDFWAEGDKLYKGMEANLRAYTEMDATFAPVGGGGGDGDKYDNQPFGMYTFEITVKDDRVANGNKTMISDAEIAQYRAALSAAVFDLTAFDGNVTCPKCGGNDLNLYVVNATRRRFQPDYNVIAGRVGPASVAFRTYVNGHLDEVRQFSHRVAAYPSIELALNTVSNCSGCVVATVSRSDLRDEHSFGQGFGNGTATVFQMAGPSFTAANSPEFAIVFENTAERLLSRNNTFPRLDTFESGSAAKFVRAELSACGHTHELGGSTCVLKVAINGSDNGMEQTSYSVADIMEATKVQLFATADGVEDLHDAMRTVTGFNLGLSANPNESEDNSITVVVGVPGRNDYDIAAANSHIKQAATDVLAMSNVTAMYTDSWKVDQCFGNELTLCLVQFTPEFWMQGEHVEWVVAAVGYKIGAAMGNQMHMWSPVPKCDLCGIEPTKPSHLKQGSYQSAVMFLSDSIQMYMPPTGNTLLRLSATIALREAGFKVNFTDVFISERGQWNGRTKLSLSFFSHEYAPNRLVGERMRINTDLADLFSHMAFHRVDTGCLHHLFKYEVMEGGVNVRYLASDACEMLYDPDLCEDDEEREDLLSVSDGRGHTYFLVPHDVRAYDDTGLVECGCDVSGSCPSEY